MLTQENNPKIRLSNILNSPGDTTDVYDFNRLVYEQSGELQALDIQNGHAKITVSNIGEERFWLSGTVSGEVMQECGRCLRPTAVPFVVDLGILLEFNPKVEKPYLDEGEAGEEVLMFGSHILDLADIFVENIMLTLPLMVLHDPECKGLCPECGIDLNPDSGQSCSHQQKSTSLESKNPFLALKNLDLPDE